MVENYFKKTQIIGSFKKMNAAKQKNKKRETRNKKWIEIKKEKNVRVVAKRGTLTPRMFRY